MTFAEVARMAIEAFVEAGGMGLGFDGEDGPRVVAIDAVVMATEGLAIVAERSHCCGGEIVVLQHHVADCEVQKGMAEALTPQEKHARDQKGT